MDGIFGTRSKTVTAVARELGMSSESLRGWYRKAKADRGDGTSGELISSEREELKRLRRENREQRQTIEILKKATLGSTADAPHSVSRTPRPGT